MKGISVLRMQRGFGMFGLGTTELIVIGAIIFLIFGAKRIPEIGKGLGGAIREFRQIKKDVGVPSGEENLLENAAKQAPAVKQAMDVKEQVEKVKDIVR